MYSHVMDEIPQRLKAPSLQVAQKGNYVISNL